MAALARPAAPGGRSAGDGAAAAAPPRRRRRVPVALYAPNVIGYVRIVLSALAFAHHREPETFAGYYTVSFVLDAADGLAARMLRQSSSFGALLDMLTDRCATAALLTVAAAARRRAAPALLALAFLDGYSHWLQFAAGLVSRAESHKSAGRGAALAWYYWRPVLTFVCTLNEFCFIAFYMDAAGAGGPPVFRGWSAAEVVFAACAPVCALKQAISVRQIFSAHYTIRDALAAETAAGKSS